MTDSDALLVRRARDGDARAFEQLVRRHLRTANAVALSLVGEPADAEDVCQDAFITALERLEDCRKPDRFRSWLLTIVRNRAHNFRRHRAMRHGPTLDSLAQSPRAEELARRDGDDPWSDTEASFLRDRLSEAVGRLPDTQGQVVVLHDLEGWKHREIAEDLGITEGTSRVYLHKARKTLREWLGSDAYEEH